VLILDHMLTLFAKHGLFDLDVAPRDLHIDSHHTTEMSAFAWEGACSSVGHKRG